MEKNSSNTLAPRKNFRDDHDREFVPFSLESPYKPCGDQPGAITALDKNLSHKVPFQTLLGVTGSGKTFTIASVLAKQNRPALVIAPNKTLAAQLYAEFKEFFPNNRVRYFVSYYDYYQPEAFVPSTNTFIEKDSAINDEIDKMRHSATRATLEGSDTIVVASVSCIYGIGAPEDYFNQMLYLKVGDVWPKEDILRKLVYLQYKRSDVQFVRGNFRVRGDVIDIFPSDQDTNAIRLEFFGTELESIRIIDALTGQTVSNQQTCAIYPVSHYVTGKEAIAKARVSIEAELKERLIELKNVGKVLEAQRLEQRTMYDLELLEEVGFCPGVENYSRHLAGRGPGEAPTTLLNYFPKDFILVIDESHVTISQIGGMYRGDRARKTTLVDYGFRLPSALDNRPLKPEEFWERVGQVIFVSATPAEYEFEKSGPYIIQQVNRPTGLLDPQVEIKPAKNQVDDLLGEIRKTTALGDRTLVTTLTKRMSEDLAEYLREVGIKCRYLHSEVTTIERVEIIRGLRRGDFDVLIGINLLREGLDLVEVSLVAILDADKEGFLRSSRSLIQTMGRAARNLRGRVILYADHMTDSMKQALAETDRRRQIQTDFNTRHGITPRSAQRTLERSLVESAGGVAAVEILKGNEKRVIELPKDRDSQRKFIDSLRKQMFEAAAKREFEVAASLRDAINKIQLELLALGGDDH